MPRPFLGFLLAVLALTGCRTPPPSVIEVEPAPGSELRLDRPLVAHLSAPLDPGSVAPGAVALTPELGHRLALSPDGRTLTITLTEQPQRLPSELTVRLTSRLVGTTGQPLVPYTWPLTLPDWVDLGKPNRAALDGSFDLAYAGGPVTLTTEAVEGGGRDLRAARRTASGWTPLGARVNAHGNAASPALGVTEDGTLYAFWHDSDLNEVRLAHWDGSAWVGERSFGVNPNWQAGLPVASRSGPLAVAWRENTPDGQHWRGYAATKAGGFVPAEPFYSADEDLPVLPHSVLADGDRIYVAFDYGPPSGPFRARVRVWDGTAWRDLGGDLKADPSGPGYGLIPHLALDRGALYASWIEYDGTFHHRVHLARWDGGGWQDLGRADPGEEATYWNELAAGPQGLAVLSADPSGALSVRGYDPERATFFDWGRSPGIGPGIFRLVLDPGGYPVVAFGEGSDLAVRAYNHVP